jgi:rare lipoprotein A (peptidoglycan hydrolase)
MTPLRIWLLSGVTATALTAVAVNVWLVPVHAKVLLPKPAATLAPAAPALQQQMAVTNPKPATAAEQRAEQRRSLLRGIASWYGDAFDGQQMANGEIFDQTKMTACHPTLPFGSLVKVKNLRNGRSVIVRITDRGALAAGRILDLSHAAAERLAMTNAGLAPVVLEVLSRGGERTAAEN